MDVTLYIGAHRTGTSFVEGAITKALPDNPSARTWPPAYMRGIQHFGALGEFAGPREKLSQSARDAHDALQQEFARRFHQLEEQGVNSLLICEENILGFMPKSFRSKAFYPDHEDRLRTCACLLGPHPTKIALSIRDYAEHWNSSYGYFSVRKGKLCSPRDARQAMLMSNRGWPDLTNTVANVWPQAEILVWRQEDLNDHALRIISRVGDIKETNALPKFTLDKVNSNARHGRDVDLFAPTDRIFLARRYARDCAKIAADARVTWIGAPDIAPVT